MTERDPITTPVLPGGLPFDASQIQFTPSGAGAVARTVQSKERDVVSVFDFMSAAQVTDVIAGTMLFDVTAAEQAAVDSLTRGGTVEYPIGTYKHLGTVTVATNGTYLRALALGGRGVKIQFEPTSAKSCFKFSNGASILSYVGISGFEFASADTTFQKNAIEFVDCSTFFARDIICGSGGVTWSGATSRGIYIRGREAATIERVQLYADAPIAFDANPNSATAQCDHVVLRDTYLVAPVNGTSPCVGCVSGAVMSNFNTEGYNAWIGGSGGFKWVDTTSALTTQNFNFRNIRFEQSTVAASYMIDLESNSVINNVLVENCGGGSGANHNGYKFRNVNRLTLLNAYYTGSTIGINVDSSVVHMNWLNFKITGSSGNVTTGQSMVFQGPADPGSPNYPNTAFWEPTTNTNPVLIGQNGTETPFTATLTGCTTAPTGSVAAIRQGNTITLSVPAFTATSNATTKSLTGMPAAFFPSAQLRGIFYGASDNGGAFVLGEAFIEANGVITLYPTLALGNWTNAGVFTSHRFSISYPATL